MRIGLVVEESQAFRMPVIEEELKRAADQYGHTVYNFTNDYAAYAKVGLLNAVLLNSGAVDLIITGCGTGMGAIIATNAFPGVQCGLVEEPVDATMFREINMGNAVAMAFSKRFGNEGQLNLRYCFDKLLCPLEQPYYIGAETRKAVEDYKAEWDALKEKTQRPIMDIVKAVDRDYLKKALDGPVFRKHFYELCQDKELAAFLKEALA